jgi:hypothetical protein
VKRPAVRCTRHAQSFAAPAGRRPRRNRLELGERLARPWAVRGSVGDRADDGQSPSAAKKSASTRAVSQPGNGRTRRGSRDQPPAFRLAVATLSQLARIAIVSGGTRRTAGQALDKSTVSQIDFVRVASRASRAEPGLLRRDDERHDAARFQSRSSGRRRAEIAAQSLRQTGYVLTELRAAARRLRRGLRSLRRQRALLLEDVNTIRETNNAIFGDIFWAHLAYGTAEDGIECLRGLLAAEPHYSRALAGFEAIDRGRRVLEDGTASAETRRAAVDLIWDGNVQLLEHEQRALVQPNLDRLSCAFARLFSMGSALTFEVRGLRQQASYFTSFYLYSLMRGIPQALHAQAWPRITRFDDRWRWICTSIVPASGDSMPTRSLPTPVCAASSTKRATTRRTPASYRVRCRRKSPCQTVENGDP